ncbi:MAG: YfcE family phosphodiesterase [Campylobacterales bacterium]|nr:YfcE family phosphodiesterase [Campylobacterales bacterium]
MKIAVLSDSHRKSELTKEAIEYLKSKGAQYLVHAGDLEIEENLKLLEDSKLPYVSVFGNNDYLLVSYSSQYNIFKEPYYFKIEDLKLKLMHLPYYLTPDSDVVIFGHTHMFECEISNNTLFLNPGEVCARNKPLSECVLLEILKDKYIINYFFKNPNENDWKSKVIEYEKQ